MINPKVYLVKELNEKLERIPVRTGFGHGLVEAGRKNENVVALCADLLDSTRNVYFKREFPKRFIEVGVGEQNLATVASGLALAGKIPFISSFAMFSPGRNWEQIRTTICYNDVPVKIVGAHAGISTGPDGATHQALEDIALMRVLPNMTVIVPCDAIEAKKATLAMAETKKPVYIRLPRIATPVFTTEKTPFEIGRAEYFRFGKDVTIVACGPLVYEALLAARDLEKIGVRAAVINNHTIKPLDIKTIIEAAKSSRCFVTVEDHQILAGLGSAIAELITEVYPIPIKRVGVKDMFGESGQAKELLEKFGLTSKYIISATKEVMGMKNEKAKEEGFMCPECGYKAYKLERFNYCPLCVICESCEKSVENCTCIEGE